MDMNMYASSTKLELNSNNLAVEAALKMHPRCADQQCRSII